MTTPEERLEAIAEAVAFAHEPDVSVPQDPTTASFERTAALCAFAVAGHGTVPKHLQQRLQAAGFAFCAERAAARHRQPAEPQLANPSPAAPPRPATPPRRGPGMLFAFAAGLAAGLLLWIALPARPTDDPERRAPGLDRTALLTESRTVRSNWQRGPSERSGDVTGDVVWSPDRQAGFLRFTGLPPLDPAHRFQLWIVDQQREGAPVDGGLFEVADAKAETIVPIHARLPVGRAAAFVVTVEDRAGVVVSKQEHVVAIARL